jgi:long-subunit fatty acid transport protein
MYVTNKTTIDQSYTKPDKSDALFPDAAKIASDIPALLTIGAQYKALPNLRVHVGGHYYFDRDANYGRTAVDSQGNTQTGNEYFLSSNSFEAALGFEFDLNDKLALSLGYLYASTSPTLAYQTDLSYSLTSHTLGFGGVYKLTPKFNLDLGILYTSYENGSKDITYPGTLPITAKETYYKSNVIGSIGLTYKF